MRNCPYQKADGSVAISSLLFVVLGLAILGYVVESGRLIQAATHAENSTNLAGLAGVTRYTDTFLDQLRERYALKKPEAEAEIIVEAAAAGEVLSPDEFAERVKRRTKEKVSANLPDIRAAARSSCVSGARTILLDNNLNITSVTCSDTDVLVEGSVSYAPVLVAPGFYPRTVMRRDKVGIAITVP